MPSRFEIPMLMVDGRSPGDALARDQLSAGLPNAELSEPDDLGVFEVTVEANDLEQALQRVWNAVGPSGADDHVVLLEHPDLPEHRQPRTAGSTVSDASPEQPV
jgi:hypothetical protein